MRSLSLNAAIVVAALCHPGRAAAVITGDVAPSLPWDASTDVYIGSTVAGTLTVDTGSQLASQHTYLGYLTTAMGEATITGFGAQWTTESLLVGFHGGGRWTLEDRGEVDAGSLWASLHDLHGDGTINASGAVLDADLRFEATMGKTQMLPIGSGGTLRLDFEQAQGMQDSDHSRGTIVAA